MGGGEDDGVDGSDDRVDVGADGAMDEGASSAPYFRAYAVHDPLMPTDHNGREESCHYIHSCQMWQWHFWHLLVSRITQTQSLYSFHRIRAPHGL